MKMPVFAVRDSALGQYIQPFTAPSKGVAVRSFADEANRGESQVSQHPDDYELHYLGEWDQESAIFSCHSPELLARAKDVKVK